MIHLPNVNKQGRVGHESRIMPCRQHRTVKNYHANNSRRQPKAFRRSHDPQRDIHMKQITSKQIRFGLQAVAFLVTLGIALSAGAAEYVIANKDGVNIRSAPNTKAEILWEVFKNFPLQVLKREGQWTQAVDFEGDKGWIYDPLLSKEKMVIVKVDAANMRIGAGTNYEIVATVKYGVVFKPLEKDGEWVKVQHKDGTTGWLHETLIWPND